MKPFFLVDDVIDMERTCMCPVAVDTDRIIGAGMFIMVDSLGQGGTLPMLWRLCSSNSDKATHYL